MLGKGSSSAVAWIESRVWTLFVDNPVDVISGGSVGLLAPLNLIRMIVLSIGPSVVSLIIWGDVRLAILGWISLLFNILLGKSWHESGWTLILHMVDVVSGGDVSLFAPSDLIAVIMLVISPRVVSLVVWANVRVTVLYWIDDLISLSKRSYFSSVWSNSLRSGHG